MNYTVDGVYSLDLQSVAKRIYYSLNYRSTFYKCLNEKYIGELRNAGTPMIEVLKTKDASVNVRATKEISSALTPSLQGYDSVKVDLTELPMDYSIRVPLVVSGSDITNAIQDAADLEDSAIAKKIDTYGYGKLAAASMDEFEWAPATSDDYIKLLNSLRAKLFNKDVTGEYRIGLGATEYANYVSALTSVLKYETMQGREGVDMGIIARAYGIDAFEINDNVLDGTIGYFFSPIAVVGDTFFSAFIQHNSPQGFPGYYVLEGNQMFGAEVVRPEAIVRLVEEVSA